MNSIQFNLKLQGRSTPFTDTKTEVIPFQAKLGIFREDLQGGQEHFEQFREFAPYAHEEPFVRPWSHEETFVHRRANA